MGPLISVIIPVYNREKLIVDALESVLNQPCRSLEIIVVDDGSSDRSAEVCKRYQARDPRIKIFQKENGGVSSARNYGIKHATGRYVAFLDSDDAWVPGAMTSALCKYVEESDADIINFAYYYCNESMTRFRLQAGLRGEYAGEEKRDPWRFSFFWTMLYKNTLLLQHQLHFPVGINDGEDEVFKTAAIYFSNRTVCTEIPLVAYRKTPGSLSRRKKDGIQKFLPYINGRLELAKVYHIDDEIWIDTQEEVCCWLMKELAVWHFKYGGRRDILEQTIRTHALFKKFRDYDLLGLGERDKREIRFYLRHPYLFESRMRLAGMVEAGIKALVEKPGIKDIFEKARYPLERSSIGNMG